MKTITIIAALILSTVTAGAQVLQLNFNEWDTSPAIEVHAGVEVWSCRVADGIFITQYGHPMGVWVLAEANPTSSYVPPATGDPMSLEFHLIPGDSLQADAYAMRLVATGAEATSPTYVEVWVTGWCERLNLAVDR
jgi:hypothetical protein